MLIALSAEALEDSITPLDVDAHVRRQAVPDRSERPNFLDRRPYGRQPPARNLLGARAIPGAGVTIAPMSSDSRPIAILIDGDNAQPSLTEHVLAETAKYGVVTTRRIYGDWTTPQMSGWKEFLHNHAFQPAQQFRFTVGKNATDSALIIEAMDLLHAETVAGFCIVSSDSDYTRLATRIREQGLFVMGVGRSDTPKSFVNACEVFVYTENLSPKEGAWYTRRRVGLL